VATGFYETHKNNKYGLIFGSNLKCTGTDQTELSIDITDKLVGKVYRSKTGKIDMVCLPSKITRI
jgi:hypothetical protein